MPPKGPDLKKFLGKRVSVKLNGSRAVTGKLSGFDVFMNLTLEDTHEDVSAIERRALGVMVVRGSSVLELAQVDR
jgi:small nuclear ribonucleoprotein G